LLFSNECSELEKDSQAHPPAAQKSSGADPSHHTNPWPLRKELCGTFSPPPPANAG